MLRAFPAQLDFLYEMLKYIKDEGRSIGLDAKKILQVELASEEVIVNIIKHGYKSHSGDIEIECGGTTQYILHIIFRDRGVPFNPLNYDVLDPSLDTLEHRLTKGHGVFFITHLMDKTTYIRDEECNILSLYKFI